MSSRSLATARARRAGENAPPVSGNRPVTSIGSQAAFAQQMPPGVGYNMPPPPNNVRTARSMQPQPPQGKPMPQQYNQFYDQQEQIQQSQQLPFNKISVSDAIGLITLRLGRVEQWIIDTDHENETNPNSVGGNTNIPDNHKIIDSSVLTNMINRLDSLEKNGSNTTGSSNEEITKVIDELKQLKEQYTKISDIVTKHTLEISKNTEQVFRFNRELTETKDILKSFMVKYDLFTQETTQNFSDYENALGDLEKRLLVENEDVNMENGLNSDNIESTIHDIEPDNTIMSTDLKSIIRQELANS
jgi:hypothetical protein